MSKYGKFTYPRDLTVGNKVYNEGIFYTIKAILSDNIEFTREDGSSFYCEKRHLEDVIDRGLLELVYPVVKDTRLARKMYPNHEVLEDGMLRIKNEIMLRIKNEIN